MPEENKAKCNIGKIMKPIGTTAAGAGLGVMGAIAGITIAAAFEVVLPVTLCLWSCGVTFGAAGLVLGLDKKDKDN